MSRLIPASSIAIGFALTFTSVPCQAGMPSALPSDLETRLEMGTEARLRFQAISFFLFGLVASIFAVKFLWNALAASISPLPRIDLLRATAVVVLWGLVFTLVLTMISGARELMTPGAWKQNGFTYELVDDPGAFQSSNTVDEE